MEVLKKLNRAQLEVTKPYHGLTKLSLGYHKIESFRESHGKFGRSVIAELKHEIIFLPKHLAVHLEENDIEELNKCEEAVYLYFGGMHKKNL